MASILLKVKGLEKILSKMTSATQDRVIKRSLKLATTYMAGWSKKHRLTGPRPKYLGVVTGNLRASISSGRVEKSGNKYTGRFGTNVEYGKSHELGLGRHRARPFLRPALEDKENKEMVLEVFVESIQKAIERG